MKKILNSKKYLLFGILLSAAIISLSSCKNDDNALPYVDLRYNPEDSYTVTASSPQVVEFEVSSTFSWEILSSGDWHTITPANGVADSIYKVRITCQENTVLDDRLDTIIIKSDHWIGKRFVLIQKGTAMLTTSLDTVKTEQSAGQGNFGIISNQDWSCEVTEGKDWLSVVSGDKGSINGNVTFEAKDNKGELRYGIITIYDRHHVEAKKVYIAQNGVLLQPEISELRILYREQDVILKVESNTKWKITKSEYDIWYTIESGDTYEGSADVKIHLKENIGIANRKSEITFTSVSDDESAVPAVKTIILKQACIPVPQVNQFRNFGWMDVNPDASGTFSNGDMICTGSKARVVFNPANVYQLIGTHIFRIKEIGTGSTPVIFFTFGDKELRYHINTSGATTDISVTKLGGVIVGNNISLDLTKSHALVLIITEVNGMVKFEYALDSYDEIFASVQTDVPVNSTATLYVGGQPGPCTWDSYEFIAPIDWDN